MPAREEELRRALESRDVLMREADHRIKNSLQLTSSLLRLQMERTEDPKSRHALELAVTRVQAIASVHGALQFSSDLRLIDFGKLMEDLCERLALLNPSVVLRCEARPGLSLDADAAIPLGLIANELLTNALRHAFPPGTHGVVTLTTVADDGLLRMTVADGGAGLPISPLEPGLGTAVVAGLAKQIGATLTTKTQPGRGTTVSVSMQIAPESERQPSATATADDLDAQAPETIERVGAPTQAGVQP